MITAAAESLPSEQLTPKKAPFKAKSVFVADPYCVDVEFISDLSNEQVTTVINQLSHPQVIIWYIGYRGLRSVGVQFYRDFLIAPTLENHTQATFWLTDLTAWGAFKNPQCSIHSFNRACEAIENVLPGKIRCIKSARIFAKMQELTERGLVDYFKKALQRDFISQPSKNFPDSNIRIRDIFSDNCPIISDWYDCDAGKTYSILQYLEGCLLIEEVFAEQVANNENDIQIVFALPNDELKYYRDTQNSFQKDIKYIITKYCEKLNIRSIRLQVKFLAFKYGSMTQDRPYNAPSKVLKTGNLSYKDIIGDLEKNKKIPTSEVTYAFSHG